MKPRATGRRAVRYGCRMHEGCGASASTAAHGRWGSASGRYRGRATGSEADPADDVAAVQLGRRPRSIEGKSL